eukprot:CAMPEP_0117448910 /NCGR_PEP_ID=MMETSP0759-20121206/7655_1 /TAXON_ID=63605 /ORGANISM="Percolomonas cosmopolitus, Strain WS" /LENGTH=137 /DNA_ID=CAMNT_0005241333 /DNA_START=29 /DNA_END=442 /DNA_ORIENTATION=-
MPASTSTLKTLRIQSSVLKRTYKELSSYKKELKIEQERLEKMKVDPETEKLRVKQQKDVVEECRVMIPNTKQRMGASVETVRNLLNEVKQQVNGNEEEAELEENKNFTEAKEIFDEVLREFPEYDEDKERKERPNVD